MHSSTLYKFVYVLVSKDKFEIVENEHILIWDWFQKF